MILFDCLLAQVLQSKKSEAFRPRENIKPEKWEEELRPSRFLSELGSFWTNEIVWRLILIYSSDSLITKQVCTVHTMDVRSTPECYFFGGWFISLNHSWVFLDRNDEWFEGLYILGCERNIHQKNLSDVRARNRTTWCPNKIAQIPFVEHFMGAASDLFILSYTETCELDFLYMFCMGSRELLSFRVLSWGTLSGAGRSRSWLFPSSSWSGRRAWISTVFEITWTVKFIDTSEHSGAC